MNPVLSLSKGAPLFSKLVPDSFRERDNVGAIHESPTFGSAEGNPPMADAGGLGVSPQSQSPPRLGDSGGSKDISK